MKNEEHNLNRQTDRQRQSNFELLRIFAILIIISHHFALHGGLDLNDNLVSLNGFWMQFLLIGGKIGVNLFVLISGYFLINSKELRISKCIKLWLQIEFYSVIFYVIMSLYKYYVIHSFVFSFKELISVLFPLSNQQWWFASTYFVLFLLHPFLNKLLKALYQRQYILFILLQLIIFSVVPFVFRKASNANELLWFVFIYSLAAYVRLYGVASYNNWKLCFVMALFAYLLDALYKWVFLMLGFDSTLFSSLYELPVLIVSLLIFIFFKNLKIKNNKLVNIIASATFGVYLIHENNYIRKLLIHHIYCKYDMNSSNLIFYSLIVIFAVFVLCTAVELARIYLFERNYMQIINKKECTIKSAINNTIDKLISRI